MQPEQKGVDPEKLLERVGPARPDEGLDLVTGEKEEASGGG